MHPVQPARNITAVLGPTNTGKTFLAIDRMLGHDSGMIGFPLRLLARENYDRVCRIRGANEVALITGEERIVPSNPRYYLCTVEAMPMDRSVAFMAVDEVQLCADPERGHIFTQRLLHARGRQETMFLGSSTAAELIGRLVSNVRFTTRPRFSELSYAGPRKLSRLPPRTAVVGFSAAKVYELAEQIRRQRGGAAVVLGALSPRTRNAQVEMYEAGEVDYLVATDAIGMGLNMGIDHVVFSSLRKFDGRAPRTLTPAEIGQIAGRAGRHMNDGTFGIVANLRQPDPEVIEAVETHSFETLRTFRWRNSALDFGSAQALRNSLSQRPPARGLVPAREADDLRALTILLQQPSIVDLAASPERVRTLWDACQIPDFRKTMSESHAQFVARIFRFLMTEDGVIPEDWVARAMGRLDRADGDIDTLIGRIEHVRTWTYVSHRDTWLKDATHWQERARTLEDRLSDTLHKQLAQRFVDRKTAATVRRLRTGAPLLAGITKTGEVVVEGEPVGQVEGFRFTPNMRVNGTRNALLTAAHRVLQDHMRGRVTECCAASSTAFSVTADGGLCWDGAMIARLKKGADIRRPSIHILPTNELTTAETTRVSKRLATWLTEQIDEQLKALARLEAAQVAGPARGLIYELCEGLGAVPRSRLARQLTSLSPEDRRTLRGLGLRIGWHAVFVPLKKGSALLRSALWTAHHDTAPPKLGTGREVSFAPRPDVPASFYLAQGYAVVGETAVRIDRLEALIRRLRRYARQGSYQVLPADRAIVGTDLERFVAIVGSVGFVTAQTGDEVVVTLRNRRKRTSRRRQRPTVPADSPFARLRELQLVR